MTETYSSADFLIVHQAFPGTTVQDLGRPGHMHIGVSPSGAADVSSFRLANRLVGNADGAACFEVMLGGLHFSTSTNRTVSVTGAPVAVHVDGNLVADATRIFVEAGARVELSRPSHGLRTYVSVSGGLIVAPVMGSAARDAMSGIGEQPVVAGNRYSLGGRRCSPDVATELAIATIPDGFFSVGVHWGPRDNLFDSADRDRFVSQQWQVSDRTDRVAARLTGQPLQIGPVAIPSEGMVRGSVEIPPSGEPIVFLADHPVTGGYPVIAVVTERGTDLLSQARPGTGVRFVPTAFQD